jgi:hypothetical protein
MNFDFKRTKRWAKYGLGYSFVTMLYQTYGTETPLINYWKNWGETDEVIQSAIIGEYIGMFFGGPIVFALASLILGLFLKKEPV